jgi:hypothetical protein
MTKIFMTVSVVNYDMTSTPFIEQASPRRGYRAGPDPVQPALRASGQVPPGLAYLKVRIGFQP